MTIGFGNGDYHLLQKDRFERVQNDFLKTLADAGANAIELHCIDEEITDYLLENEVNLDAFSYVSIHTPGLPYADDEDSNRILSKFQTLSIKLKLDNILFHPIAILDWDVFLKYSDLPISIENMDNRKDFGRTVDNMLRLMDKYDFKLTLDLQHCYVNDPSMMLAEDFQRECKGRIAQYHLSGFDEEFNHYCLYKTKQDEIIRAIQDKELPIIIESGFKTMGDHEKELEYIVNKI